jgi:hypothetical protein
MSVEHLRKWDVTAIEIALDLETPRLPASSHLAFSGPAEPRICFVAAFALTSQLKRIIGAVDRAIPARLPSQLRIFPATTRHVDSAAVKGTSIQPMRALLLTQSKLIRAIEPGIVDSGDLISLARVREMGDASARFVHDFIPCKMLPLFEPQYAAAHVTDLRATGITIYRLGNGGAPEAILAHWPYAAGSRGSLPLESGP